MNELAERHMNEGCPVDLTNHRALYDQLTSYLEDIGQLDGKWAADSKITDTYSTELPLAVSLREFFIQPSYVPAVTQKLAAAFPKQELEGYDYGWDLHYLRQTMGFEFAVGWAIFPVRNGETTVWILSGMLFPEYDGETEAWMVFACVDEVFVTRRVEAA